MSVSDHLDRLSACLCRLSGIGRRSAERLAYQLATDTGGLARDLGEALEDIQRNLRFCERCGNLRAVEEGGCRYCTAPGRDASLLCIVEQPGDTALIEKSGAFRGRYHVLSGKLSPMHGAGPESLRMDVLFRRLDEEPIQEVILALPTDMEGDATAAYIKERLKGRSVRVTRLAFGLPAGSGVMYSDALTIARAIQGRQNA